MKIISEIVNAVNNIGITAADVRLRNYHCCINDRGMPYWLAHGMFIVFKVFEQADNNKALIIFHTDTVGVQECEHLVRILDDTINDIILIKQAICIGTDACHAILAEWTDNSIVEKIENALVEIGLLLKQENICTSI